MAEQQADDPRVDVALGRFGEQQHAAGLEHAMELGDRALLVDQMVESLMAKQQVDRGVGQLDLGARTANELGLDTLRGRVGGSGGQHGGIDVHADQARGREARVEFGERTAIAAADIGDDRVTARAGRQQRLQVDERALEYVQRPGGRAQEPLAKRGLVDVGMCARGSMSKFGVAGVATVAGGVSTLFIVVLSIHEWDAACCAAGLRGHAVTMGR